MGMCKTAFPWGPTGPPGPPWTPGLRPGGAGGITTALDFNPPGAAFGGAPGRLGGGIHFKTFEVPPSPRAGGPGSRGVRGGREAPPRCIHNSGDIARPQASCRPSARPHLRS